MSKKKVLSLALVVIMIAILSFSTLAWFNDKDEVTNNFFVADSDDNTAEEVFSIDLLEKVDTDGDGVANTIGEDEKGGSATYEDILPGSKLVKNPVVQNTGYYSQYVRVIVTLSDYSAWVAALGANADLSTLLVGIDATKWTAGASVVDATADKISFVYYLNGVLEQDKTAELFTHVQIPAELDQTDMAKLNDDSVEGFTLHIRAQAIQTENLGDGVDTAAEAFAAANWADITQDAP